MANIALGQSITGAFTTEDPVSFGYRLDQYDLTGLDDYRQLTIDLTCTNTITPLLINLLDTNTGTVIAVQEAVVSGQGKISLNGTTVPGVSYRLLVGGQSGNYTISTVDGGRATSLVSTTQGQGGRSQGIVTAGTVGASGKFFPLAASTLAFPLTDLALAPNGQLYGVGESASSSIGSVLYQIDPRTSSAGQVSYAGGSVLTAQIKDTQGNKLNGTIDAIEFANSKLYALDRTTTGDKLYTIDPTNRVATLVGNLPSGFVTNGDDFVFDATNNRFFATAIDTTTSDALWQIPIANPAGASKIGQIGFTGLTALDFENGQLTGFKNGTSPTKISINPTTGAGTLGQVISGILSISGAASIPSSNTPLSIAEFKKDPAKYMVSIRDYDGNNLGGSNTWKSLGDVDINGDGTLENILVNPKIERFASVGAVGGTVDFTKHGLNGDTRVVGIYLDPTLKNNPEQRGGPFDSQRRFQNDLKIDNLKILAADDYDRDGFQDVYFKLGDGSAVLRALMFKDGNIQYANYQSKTDLAAFMTFNNINSAVWSGWL
jgi:hypothetical protein